jgi:hypothetical protein
MGVSGSCPSARSVRGGVALLSLLTVVAVFASLLLAPPVASAGQASSGKLLFYPCTDCHPVTLGADGKPTKPLPNGFTTHGIVLEGHDVLGNASAGTDACLVCHDSPARNPGKLKAADGTLIDVTGDVSLVCFRCHSLEYNEWKAGTHGKHQPECTSAGCHDPHTPGYIYAAALPPFQGTGFQIQVLPTRVEFKPFGQPPLPPAIVTPSWYAVGAGVALLALLLLAGGLVRTSVRGRLDR